MRFLAFSLSIINLLITIGCSATSQYNSSEYYLQQAVSYERQNDLFQAVESALTANMPPNDEATKYLKKNGVAGLNHGYRTLYSTKPTVDQFLVFESLRSRIVSAQERLISQSFISEAVLEPRSLARSYYSKLATDAQVKFLTSIKENNLRSALDVFDILYKVSLVYPDNGVQISTNAEKLRHAIISKQKWNILAEFYNAHKKFAKAMTNEEVKSYLKNNKENDQRKKLKAYQALYRLSPNILLGNEIKKLESKLTTTIIVTVQNDSQSILPQKSTYVTAEIVEELSRHELIIATDLANISQDLAFENDLFDLLIKSKAKQLKDKAD